MAAAFSDITNQIHVHDRQNAVKSFNETHHKATKLRPPQLAIADLAALEASALQPAQPPSAGTVVPMSPITNTISTGSVAPQVVASPTTNNSSFMQSISQRRGFTQTGTGRDGRGIITPTCVMELDAACSPIFPPTQTPTGVPHVNWCPGAPLRPNHGNYHTLTRCSTPMSGVSGPAVPLARTLSFSTNSTPCGTPMAGYRPMSVGFPHAPLPSPLNIQSALMRGFSFSQASTPLTPSPEGLAWGDAPSAPQKVLPTHDSRAMTPVPFSYQTSLW